ncbi:hypothetical protein Q8A67_022785 [Cirrhinus molitorella]|uniref:Uncharacterized protein n=1 Tax=Cirrhinus molitorella TaxID=172907 RepID=A0AA88PGA8_9TELE|nr:hypothetical protein Q8A67_022785 [Cirrhinus molitorella]
MAIKPNAGPVCAGGIVCRRGSMPRPSISLQQSGCQRDRAGALLMRWMRREIGIERQMGLLSRPWQCWGACAQGCRQPGQPPLISSRRSPRSPSADDDAAHP